MFEIEKEPLETHEVMLTITIDDETKQQAMKKAAHQIARSINIPGFRRGRAPYQVVKQYVGANAILNEAIDNWLEQTYPDILEQAEIDPYGPGQLISKQTEPLTVKIRVPLSPTVDLGDYRSLRVEWQEPEIDEEEITVELEKLREQYAVLEPVERPVDWGDMVIIDLLGLTEGEQIFSEKNIEVVMKEDSPLVVPGIMEEIVGMQQDQEKTFTLTLPDDETIQPENLRGEEVSFTVSVHEVYNQQLPELDDAFALTVGNFNSLDELKADIRQQHYEKALKEARKAYQEQVLTELIKTAEIHYPPEMVTEEIHNIYRFLESDLRSSGVSLEDLLRLQGKTKEQYYAELQPQAVRNLETGLVLSSLLQKEQLTVTDEELKSHLESAQVHSAKETETLASRLLKRKVMEWLEMVARGNLPKEEKAAASEEFTEDTPES